MDLSPRREKILAAVIEQYISTGEPVGSKALCLTFGLTVSSATIRNEMALLSELGFLEQPHTSAGRIPSVNGYRYYVDHLMDSGSEPSPSAREAFESKMDIFEGEPERILSRAADLLARSTGCAAVCSTPSDIQTRISRADIVPIGRNSALVVLSTTSGVLKTRLCHLDGELDMTTASLFYSIVQSIFLGRHTNEVSKAAIQSAAASLGDKAFFMTPLLGALYELAQEVSVPSVISSGASNLLSYRESRENAEEFFFFMRNKPALAQLLSGTRSGAPTIRIGSENRFRELRNESSVLCGYRISGRDEGAVGVIGPIRMDYRQIIPNVVCISELVSALLTGAAQDQVK